MTFNAADEFLARGQNYSRSIVSPRRDLSIYVPALSYNLSGTEVVSMHSLEDLTFVRMTNHAQLFHKQGRTSL